MTFEVDPDALRAWSRWLDGLSGDIKQMAEDVTVGYSAKFPGTELEGALDDTRDVIKTALNSLSSRQAEMSEIAHGTGDEYEITDIDFAARLQAMKGLQ